MGSYKGIHKGCIKASFESMEQTKKEVLVQLEKGHSYDKQKDLVQTLDRAKKEPV